MADSLGRVQIIVTAAAAVVRILKGYRDAKCAWMLLPASSAIFEQAPTRHSLQFQRETDAGLRKPALETAAAGQAEASLAAGALPADLARKDEDTASQVSSEESFASARDASFAQMDTDQDTDDKQVESAPPAHQAAQAGMDSSPGIADSRAEGVGTQRAHLKQSRQSGAQGTDRRLLLAVHAPRRGVVDVWQAVHGPRLCSVRAGRNCCMLTAPPLFGLGAAAGAACDPSYSSCYMLDCASGQLQSMSEAVASTLSTAMPMKG